MSKDTVKKLKKQNTCVRDVLEMDDAEVKSLGLSVKALNEIRAIPIHTAANISMTFETDKTSGKNEGTVKFDLIVSRTTKSRNGNVKPRDDYTFFAALGTPQSGFLLSQDNVMVSLNGQKKGSATRSVALHFDWTLANSCAGANGGYVVLRVLCADVQGFDIEYFVPLK